MRPPNCGVKHLPTITKRSEGCNVVRTAHREWSHSLTSIRGLDTKCSEPDAGLIKNNAAV